MMRKLTISLMMIMVLLVTGLLARAAGFISPYAMLQTYFNAINRREFRAAYALWLNPLQTYENYANGYADTSVLENYLGDFQASSIPTSGRVPVVLIGYRTTGQISTYYGCLAIRDTGNQNWRIENADIRVAMENGQLPNTSIVQFLSINCYGNLQQESQPAFNQIPARGYYRSEQQNLLFIYYNQFINFRDYQTAYSLWLHPIPGPKPNGAPAVDYRPPYTRFVNGYRDTTWANVYTGEFVYTGASAGHPYVEGLLPTVLVGQKSNGAFETYYGCYVIGTLNIPNYPHGIVSGKFTKLANDVVPMSAMQQYLTMDCTEIPLQY